MSYFTQRIANAFPMWSKVRTDPSSNGYRWIEAFAKEIEIERINAVRLANLGFFSNAQEVPNLYYIDLNDPAPGYEAQSFVDEETGVQTLPEYIKVRVAAPTPDYVNGGGFPEIRVDENGAIEFWITVKPSGEDNNETRYYDFIYSAPDELAVKSYLDIWDNDQSEWGVNPELPFNFTFELDVPEVKEDTPNKISKNFGAPFLKLKGSKVLSDFPDNWLPFNLPVPFSEKRRILIFSSTEEDPSGEFSGWHEFDEGDRELPTVPWAPVYFTGWKLEVRVKNSRHYQRWSHPDSDPKDPKDKNFSGNHKIIIYGYDANGLPVGGTGAEGEEPMDIGVNGESIGKLGFIPDDGVYRSQESYTELWGISWEGFDGDVEIYIVPGNTEEHINPFHAAITADSSNAFGDLPEKTTAFTPAQISNALEGPLRLELEEVAGGSFLHSTYQLFLRGEEYRRNNIPLESEEDNREILCSQWLLDAGASLPDPDTGGFGMDAFTC